MNGKLLVLLVPLLITACSGQTGSTQSYYNNVYYRVIGYYKLGTGQMMKNDIFHSDEVWMFKFDKEDFNLKDPEKVEWDIRGVSSAITFSGGVFTQYYFDAQYSPSASYILKKESCKGMCAYGLKGALLTAFRMLSKNVVIVKTLQQENAYMQVADLFSYFESIKYKIQKAGLSKYEIKFFGEARKIKKDYLKQLEEKYM